MSRKTKAGREERSVLFNDALNTFYLRLYGVGHMVNDHSDSGRGNPLSPLNGLLLLLSLLQQLLLQLLLLPLRPPLLPLHSSYYYCWERDVAPW